MNESVIYLPEVDSTNLWAKHNLDKFGPIGAVYTTQLQMALLPNIEYPAA